MYALVLDCYAQCESVIPVKVTILGPGDSLGPPRLVARVDLNISADIFAQAETKARQSGSPDNLQVNQRPCNNRWATRDAPPISYDFISVPSLLEF